MLYCLGKRTCNVCGSWLGYKDNDPVRPRESFSCRRCMTNSRQRAMVYLLGSVLGYDGPAKYWPEDKSICIFESSGMRGYPPILAKKYTYYNTEFDPEITSGGNFDATKYADIQDMQYPDNTFDVVLSSDVLEHVRDYTKALSELYRVLKDDGSLILQVPYDHEKEKTLIRIEVDGDKDIHLMEPYYHAGKYLVYRDYGRDLLKWVADAGFSVTRLCIENRLQRISRQDVIIATKSSYADLALSI